MNSLPRPAPSLVAETVPPCSSTSFRTTVSPMPRPPCDRSSEGSTWVNSSKTRCNIVSGIPMPSSATRNTTEPSSIEARMAICPPSGVYLAAFVSRLTRICSMRVGSTNSSAGSAGGSTFKAWRRNLISNATESTARCSSAAASIGSRLSSILSRVIRDTSNKSSMRCTRFCTWRSIISPASPFSEPPTRANSLAY